ncbi:MAG: tetracycline resistance MFS efflux pump [Pirellulaceae bacterium]|nr:MAG: tetracycline resistance MFS efflux pump [Pirellulaceae bacterium]
MTGSSDLRQPEGPGRGSLWVIFLTVFVDLLGFGIVVPLLPIYADQFTVDEAGWQIGALMASYSAMQFLFAPIWGRISDRVGRRPVLIVGLCGSVFFYLSFAIATIYQHFWLLFFSRVGAGIAGATIPTAQAYIADSTTAQQRHKGMALIGMAFGLGFTFGPLVGFLAVPDRHGVPGPWPGYVAAALSMIALAMAVFWLPESRHSKSASAHRWWDVGALRLALQRPSIGMLLAAMFVCVFSFAKFETTLSMLIKGPQRGEGASELPFHFSWGEVCLTYSYIGLLLSLVQGGVVRRLAGLVSESAMAVVGAVAELAGFVVVIAAIHWRSVPVLLAALALVVSGFAFMQPSLNSLLSRRTAPDEQGGVLGIGQSINALARILGPALGIPMLKAAVWLPYVAASALMLLGLIMVQIAGRSGHDFAPTSADS